METSHGLTQLSYIVFDDNRPVCYFKTCIKISVNRLKCASRIVRNLSNRAGQKSGKFAKGRNPGNTYRPVAVTQLFRMIFCFNYRFGIISMCSISLPLNIFVVQLCVHLIGIIIIESNCRKKK